MDTKEIILIKELMQERRYLVEEIVKSSYYPNSEQSRAKVSMSQAERCIIDSLILNILSGQAHQTSLETLLIEPEFLKRSKQ